MINFHNIDCMDFMESISDKAYDLAIVDPPYGLEKSSTHGRGKLKNRIINLENIHKWDNAPGEEYFRELFRVSKNQIIWGGNYFHLPPSRCVLVWDKVQPWENFSQVEIAWTSYVLPAKLYRFDNRRGGKIHPTQKPVELYSWILSKFKEKKILDTHGGSMSIALACHDFGRDLDICEIDKKYFDAGKARYEEHISQGRLF